MWYVVFGIENLELRNNGSEYSLARTTGAGSKNEAKFELKMQKKGKKDSKSGVFSCEFVVNLKKQSQFAKWQNERKYLYER